MKKITLINTKTQEELELTENEFFERWDKDISHVREKLEENGIKLFEGQGEPDENGDYESYQEVANYRELILENFNYYRPVYQFKPNYDIIDIIKEKTS